jgi:hypothetical protein
MFYTYRFIDEAATLDYSNFFRLCLDLAPLHSPRQLLSDWLHSTVTGHNALGNKDFCGSWLPIDDCDWHALPGEFKAHTVEHLRWKLNSTVNFSKDSKVKLMSGLVFVTNYRVVLLSRLKYAKHPRSTRYDPPTFFDEISVPLASILSVEEIGTGLQIRTKANRTVYVTCLRKPAGRASIAHFASALKGDIARAYQPFAFKNRRIHRVEGWDLIDVREEYERLGFNPENGWNVS